MREPFRERLGKSAVVFDGGMGTMLYAKGVYFNRCFDEVNLSAPHLVKQVHEDFLRAGSDVVETNTFGASSYKLQAHGLGDKMAEINLAGARIARQAAGDDRWVAGSVGPLGVAIEPLGRVSFAEARADFAARIEALVKGGVDLIVLETFQYVSELEQAILAARQVTDLPVIAQLVPGSGSALAVGTPLDTAIIQLDELRPDAIGLNCAVGPKEMLDALELMAPLTGRPISMLPNADATRVVEGRTFYLCSPEYLGEYAKRFIQTGARIVGGCCGTTPEHIRAVHRAVKAIEPPARVQVQVPAKQLEPAAEVRVYDRAEKSRLACRLADGKFVTMCELVAPRGVSPERELGLARQLAHHGVDAINIPDGPRASSRMSALALAVLIQRSVGVEALLHYTCRDRNVIGMQSDLLGAWALGVRNILAITGDPPKLGNYPNATGVFDVDSIGLTNLLNQLNHGLDLAGNPIGAPTGFQIAVGANPGAINLNEELKRLDFKVQAGAELIITQPVFDIEVFYQFLRKIEHIHVPVIAGIWPLVSLRNAEFLNNEVPGASVPEPILARMRAAKTPAESLQAGAAIARETLDAVKPLVQGVQVAVPLGRASTVLGIIAGVL